MAAGEERAYAIRGRADDAFHGICGLNRVDQANRTASLGYGVRTTSTSRGFARRAARRLLVHAIEDLGLERVEIVVSTHNAPSIRVAQRLDLHEEGSRRGALRVGDEQHDARVFAAFASDLARLQTSDDPR